MPRIETREFADGAALAAYLIELSRADCGAFLATVAPYSHTTTIHRFASPGRIPDHMVDVAAELPDRDHCIAFRGQLRSFTRATIIRDQNRACGRD